ncbi:MAG: hypothetical protein ACJAS4_002100 [Bacteriovoracaceae bacterium]|jgi:hypothetical protein
MVDKVKALNWNLFSKFFVIFSYVSIIYSIYHIALHTKSLENSTIIMYYLIIGIIMFLLMKMNDVANEDTRKSR